VDRLWSPWRLEYVTSNKTDTGCVFCDARRSLERRPPDPDSLIVYDRKTCYVILNLYPYNNGHLLIVPHRHTPSLASLTTEEAHETADLMQLCERALLDAYQPHGHVHVVPRWNGDTNFMTVVGETRVLPEELPQSAARLKPIFHKLGTSL
jgi:ATP adenylyltransferase